MDVKHVVVDGSNIATEGRTAPSLEQLDEAVRAFLDEYGEDLKLTVVVDATFGHRIDAKERPAFEAGIVNGELVAPPAGAIGRGDAFILQIADKTGATVFSNDSFQEFHGIYDWLFEDGRLVGGKPVPAVGWVFVLRTPVRGETSRRATRGPKGAKGGRGTAKPSAPLGPMPVPTGPPPRRRSKAGASGEGDDAVTDDTEATTDGEPTEAAPKKRRRSRGGSRSKSGASVVAAAVAADEAGASKGEGGGRRRRGSSKPADPINELQPFIDFVGAHPVGTEVDATVDRFSSHGAYAVADGGAQCYIPLKAMADPAPTRGRDVFTVGEVRTFVVTSFDPALRGIDVALPGVVVPDATSEPTANDRHDDGFPDGDEQHAEEAPSMAVTKKAAAKKAPAKKAAAKKAPAKKAAAAKAPAKKAPAKKAPAKKAPATKAPAKKAPATKAPAKKAPAKKAPATKAPAKKAPAKKAPATKAPAKKAPAKKAPATKAPAKKAPATKAPAKKAPAKKAPAKKAPATKAPAKKAPAKKAPAKKAPAKKAPAKKAAAKK
jgi:hypothetical protein